MPEEMRVAMYLASFVNRTTSFFAHVIAFLKGTTVELTWERNTTRFLEEYVETRWNKSSKINGRGAPENEFMALAAKYKSTWNYAMRVLRQRTNPTEVLQCYKCSRVGHIVEPEGKYEVPSRSIDARSTLIC